MDPQQHWKEVSDLTCLNSLRNPVENPVPTLYTVFRYGIEILTEGDRDDLFFMIGRTRSGEIPEIKMFNTNLNKNNSYNMNIKLIIRVIKAYNL